MKTKRLPMLVVFAIVIFICGCTGGEKRSPLTTEEGVPLTPVGVVEKFYSAIQSGEKIDFSSLFSAVIPAEIRDGFANDFRKQKEILRLRVTGTEEKGNAVVVTVKYIYFEKKPEGEAGYEAVKRKLGENKLTLMKENGAWRIRKFGEKIDEKVEKQLFYNCLSVVLDASIAQEIYRGGHKRYAASIAALEPVLPIRAERCRELKIQKAEKNDYLVLASSPNLVPCSILATTDGAIPMKYEECRNQ